MTTFRQTGNCLSADQLDDHLVGDLAPAAAAHLAACPLCQARLAEAEAPLASFRDVSLAWAERRSATLPLRPDTAPARPAVQRFAWASAVVAVAALAVALPLTRHHDAAQPSAETVAAVGHTGITSSSSVAATPEQIARDNEMLEAIDQALDAPSPSAAEYGLTAASVAGRAHVQGHPVRD